MSSPDPASAPTSGSDSHTTKNPRFSTGRVLLLLFAALLGTYVTSTLLLPWKSITVVFAVAGVVLGIMGFRRTSAAKTPMLLPLACLAGMLGCVFFGAIAVAQMLFWGPTVEFEQCVSEALTDRALRGCSTQYSNELGVTGS